MGRRKIIQDDDLLAVARAAFIEKGFAASTREIARRAGVSEAVIYQRHPTKARLFFAAMIPPALDLEDLLTAAHGGLSALERLDAIALGVLQYFRKIVPILLRLMTHPAFDFEAFAADHPESPFDHMRLGLARYLDAQREIGNIATGNPGAVALTLLASLHSIAIMEQLGVHHGRFDDAVVRSMVHALWAGLEPRRASDRRR
ncbi:MAG: TetR/AcrR family transcriptional regulator [Planctomycetes bacterium]|nr:TetR/AcrR family transcriptional regulator [Planctomycetota bacterium]